MADPSTPHEVGPAWEPLPVAVARLVTAGDRDFVKRVHDDLKAPALKDPRQLKVASFDAPNALVRRLEIDLRDAGLIPSSPCDQFPPVLVRPRGGRFQQLVADFEHWLRQLPEKELSSFAFEDHIRKYLRGRVDAAYALYFEGIANCEIEAKGVLVDGKEYPADNMPASAITKDMKIGDDGLLYQGEYKRSPAWKLVEVRAKQHRLSPESEARVPAEPKAAAEPQLPRTMSNILRGIVEVSKARGDILWLNAAPRDRDAIVHEALFELGLKSEKQPSNQQSFARIMREFIRCHGATVGPYVEAQIADIPDARGVRFIR